MDNIITIRTNKSLKDWEQTMCRRYKYSGDGYAWETKKSFSNYLFFHDLKIEKINKGHWNKFRKIFLNNPIPRCGKEFVLVDFEKYMKYEEYNEILTLQNGDYVIQKQLLNNDIKNISLYSGHHKNHGLIVDYRMAENILKKVSFPKVIKNQKVENNEIAIMEFLGSEKIILKKTLLTIDANDLSIEDKKATIRAYKSKFEESVIMFNNGLFFIFEGGK